MFVTEPHSDRSAETLNVSDELERIVHRLKDAEREHKLRERLVAEAEAAWEALADQERADLRYQGGPWPKATNDDIDALVRIKYRVQHDAVRSAEADREALNQWLRNITLQVKALQTISANSRKMDDFER